MIQKVTITRVHRGEADTQFGKKNKIAIKTDATGDKWLSAFVPDKFDPFKDLIEGYMCNIVIEQKGDFLNFRMLQPVDRLEARVEALESAMKGLNNSRVVPTGVPNAAADEYPDGPNPDDIPF